MNNSTFGQRIKSERLKLGLSQAAFAKIGKVSQATQASYESDSRLPDLGYVSLLAEETGIDQYFIVTGKSLKQELAKIFDWDLVLEIFATIDYWAETQNIEVPLEKKIDLVRVLYAQFSETGKIDDPTMQAALRLVA